MNKILLGLLVIAVAVAIICFTIWYNAPEQWIKRRNTELIEEDISFAMQRHHLTYEAAKKLEDADFWKYRMERIYNQ
jgi:hypothetical protein